MTVREELRIQFSSKQHFTPERNFSSKRLISDWKKMSIGRENEERSWKVGRTGETDGRGERRMKKYERKNKKVISKMFSGKERSGPGGGGGEEEKSL